MRADFPVARGITRCLKNNSIPTLMWRRSPLCCMKRLLQISFHPPRLKQCNILCINRAGGRLCSCGFEIDSKSDTKTFMSFHSHPHKHASVLKASTWIYLWRRCWKEWILKLISTTKKGEAYGGKYGWTMPDVIQQVREAWRLWACIGKCMCS